MGLAHQDAVGVEADDLHHPLLEQILAPLAGGEVPEGGEDPQHDQGQGRIGVDGDRRMEVEPVVQTMQSQSGVEEGEDQQRLGPVPEALVTGVEHHIVFLTLLPDLGVVGV